MTARMVACRLRPSRGVPRTLSGWLAGGGVHAAVRWGMVGAISALLMGCDGRQSALAPAGREAAQLAWLFWWMAGGAAVIWAAVVGLGVYAIRVRPESFDQRRGARLIIGGGAVVPTIVLAALLAYGLWMLPSHVAPAPEGSLRIAVTGEQWWWRVRYLSPDGEGVDLANEIRLPVGEPVEFVLESSDVIHAFWIPPLAGKRDMIPGRMTRLALTPTRTGVFRGVCAEYCGDSHALMSFDVIVLEKDEFSRWLREQMEPARAPETPLSVRGGEAFLASGCGACHSVRGTPATGVIGPDLTHVGSRLSIGAGVLANEEGMSARWIGEVDALKPGVHMPAFGMLPAEDVRAIGAYLEGLR